MPCFGGSSHFSIYNPQRIMFGYLFYVTIVFFLFTENACSFKMSLHKRLKKRQFKSHYRHHCLLDPRLDERDGGGVQNLCNLHDYAYVGPVSVGTPEQIVWMDFDTGSADSWLMTNDCKTRTCLTFPRFDTSLSLTLETKKERLKFVYGLGDTMQGYRASDTICMGTLCVYGMDFAAATHVDQGNAFMDGLLGLAYPSLSIFPTSSFLDRVKPRLQYPLFAVWLNRDTDLQSDGGEITFGYSNPSRYLGQLHYLPVVNRTFWTVHVDDAYLSDPRTGWTRKLDSCKPSQQCRAILDTATSFIIGPRNSTANLISKWESQKLVYLDKNRKWSLDCVQMEKMPDLIFVLGKKTFALKPEDYTLAEDAFAPCDRKLALDSHVDVDFWVLGGAFIGKFYSVFDFGNHRVGLAESAKHQPITTRMPPFPDIFFRNGNGKK